MQCAQNNFNISDRRQAESDSSVVNRKRTAGALFFASSEEHFAGFLLEARYANNHGRHTAFPS